MKCPNCHKTIPEGKKFCRFCGYKMQMEISSKPTREQEGHYSFPPHKAKSKWLPIILVVVLLAVAAVVILLVLPVKRVGTAGVAPSPMVSAPIEDFTDSTVAAILSADGGCNAAMLLRETIPDNTVFRPGEKFVKVWTVENVGSCTWNENYRFLFVKGDSFESPTNMKIGPLKPAELMNLQITMQAPSTPGDYVGYWKLQSDTGFQFFQLTVVIKVRSE